MSGSSAMASPPHPLDDSSAYQTSSVSQSALFAPSFSRSEHPPYSHGFLPRPENSVPGSYNNPQHYSTHPVSYPKPHPSQMLRVVPSTIGSTSYPARRPARPITKCDRCRSRKSRCDSGQPCGPCQKSKAVCLYTDGRPTKCTQERDTSCISRPHSNQPISTVSLREERNNLIAKIDTLHKLLNDVNARQALQAHEISFSLQKPLPTTDYVSGIDLECDNLITHFSKLWLRKEPDQSFFQATHPALVKLRQDQVPQWQKSRRWRTWSDYQAESKYQQLTRFDTSLLPEENECHNLSRQFIMSCNWYFEVLTETEANSAEAEVHHYRSLRIVPTSPKQWTRIALSLAVCRLTLACLDWAGTDESEQISRKRCERILNWCDLAVMALQRAGMDQNPTVEAMRVLIILTSTIFFETDYGLMGSSPQMLKLHKVAIEVSERLNLHRDPPPHLSSKEKDDRRRMWWALVTIDSHFCSTGAASTGVLRIQDSDTKLPVARDIHTIHAHDDDSLAPLDLRSARSRFQLGKLNNRCCQLLAQRKPLATLSDIWRLDQDLVALESRVPDEQRLSSDIDLNMISQRPLRPSGPIDDALRNGQQIFYIGLWHIRSKIHRGLIYKKQSTSDNTCQVNVDAHRDIVRRCSSCLLHLYRHTKLPTAFISAIASAALTLSLELLDQPSQPYSREIRTIVIECFSRLQTNSSPIIGRACQVLEYFLGPLLPHTGISKSFSAGMKEWHEVDPCVILSEDSPESSTNCNAPYVNCLPKCEVKISVEADKNSKLDGSSGSQTSRTEDEKGSASNTPYFDSTSQPTIGLTNPLPQVTPHDLLTFVDQGTLFQYQEKLQEPCLEQSNGYGFASYSNDTQDQSIINLETPSFERGSSNSSTYMPLIETPSFERGCSNSSNYLPLMTPIGGYETLGPMPGPTILNSTIYSNDVKGDAYSTIEPNRNIQPRDGWPAGVFEDEMDHYGPNNFAGRVFEHDILNHSGRIGDAGFVGDAHQDSVAIRNGNYSMDASSNTQGHCHT